MSANYGQVEAAVRRDLRKVGESLRGPSALAATALALAQLLDGEFIGLCRECQGETEIRVEASARDAAAVTRELRATMEVLGRHGDSDSGDAFVASLFAPVGDGEEPRAADPRRRGRADRGGAGDAVDAVAAAGRRRRA